MNNIEQIMSTLTAEADYIRENTSGIQQACDSIQYQLSSLSALDSIKNSIESISTTLQAPAPTIFGMSEGLARIIVPALVSLFVFLAGLLANWLSKNWANRTKAESFKQSILYWCTELIPTLEKQKTALEQFSNEVSSLNEINTVTLSLYPIQLDQLNTIPLEKYIYAFKDTTTIDKKNTELNDKSIEYYTHGMVSQLKFLSDINNQIKAEYNTYLNRVQYYMEEWNKINKTGKDLCDQLIATHPHDTNAKQLMAIIILVLNNAPQGVNIAFMKKNYIDPILTWSALNMQHQAFGVEAQKIRSIFLALDELIYKYNTEILGGYAARYSDSAERLSKGVESLKNAVNFFSKCKTKYIVEHYL